jgi:hypothetical protein
MTSHTGGERIQNDSTFKENRLNNRLDVAEERVSQVSRRGLYSTGLPKDRESQQEVWLHRTLF